jgi:Domain of Unknown Function (DUF326)
MHIEEMIRTSPGEPFAPVDILSRCIEACFECAQTCSACADACLSEEQVKDLVSCISLNEVCSDMCATTGSALSRTAHGNALPLRSIAEACAATCASCADECERHAGHMEHCRVCAEACRRCEQACRELVDRLAA